MVTTFPRFGPDNADGKPRTRVLLKIEDAAWTAPQDWSGTIYVYPVAAHTITLAKPVLGQVQTFVHAGGVEVITIADDTGATIGTLGAGDYGTVLALADFSTGAPVPEWLTSMVVIGAADGLGLGDLAYIDTSGNAAQVLLGTGVFGAVPNAINFPGSGPTVFLDSDGNFNAPANGTYTPTRSAESNLDSNVVPTSAIYFRIGNRGFAAGQFSADPTAPGATSFELSLGIASNIGAVTDVSGVASCAAIAGQVGAISGSIANNTAVFSWTAVDLTAQTWSYLYSWNII